MAFLGGYRRFQLLSYRRGHSRRTLPPPPGHRCGHKPHPRLRHINGDTCPRLFRRHGSERSGILRSDRSGAAAPNTCDRLYPRDRCAFHTLEPAHPVGYLLPKDHWLVYGEQPHERARARCSEHGDLQPPAITRTDPPLRQGWPVHLCFEFGNKEAGLLPSMGSVADAYDDSMAESFVSTLKRELIHRHSWPNRQRPQGRLSSSTSRASTAPAEGTPRSDTSDPQSTRKLE